MTTPQTALGPCSAGGWRFPCSQMATVLEEGKPYCTQHAPSTVAARHAASAARWQAERDAHQQAWQAEQEMQRRAACYPDLLAAVEAALPFVWLYLSEIEGTGERHSKKVEACWMQLRAAISRAKEEA